VDTARFDENEPAEEKATASRYSLMSAIEEPASSSVPTRRITLLRTVDRIFFH